MSKIDILGVLRAAQLPFGHKGVDWDDPDVGVRRLTPTYRAVDSELARAYATLEAKFDRKQL